MSKKEKLISYGYVGRWLDGTLGWFAPKHLSKYNSLKRPSPPVYNEFTEGEKFELCKITVEPVPSRRRRRPKL